MNFKKMFYLVIVLVVMLASCQSTPASETENSASGVVVEQSESVEESGEETGEAQTLHIMGPWLATEADAFEAVLDGFRESTGIEVVYEGIDDVVVPLTTRVAAGNPPDLAILAVANGLVDLHDQGALLPLDPFAEEISASFDQGWIDQFTFDDGIYAIPVRANVANLLWYNPSTIGAEAPASWAELIDFCDNNVAAGEYCTSGIANTTFTLSILFEDVYLSSYGIDQWNDLMYRRIPWTDDSVVETMNRIATFYSDAYSAGGSAGALGTGLVDGIARVFGENADATFVAGGSWVSGIVTGAVNENIVEGETIDFVLFPGEEAGKGAIIAAADVAVMLSDSPESRQLVQYLMGAEGQSRFAPSGYTVANKNVDPELFTGLAAKSANLLVNSSVAPSTGAAMSNDMRNQLIEVVGAAVLDPSSIGPLLEALEASAN